MTRAELERENEELKRFLRQALKPHREVCEVKRWADKLGFGPAPICSCPSPAASPTVEEALDAFHVHLDGCQQCREHPFALCKTGFPLFRLAGESASAGR